MTALGGYDTSAARGDGENRFKSDQQKFRRSHVASGDVPRKINKPSLCGEKGKRLDRLHSKALATESWRWWLGTVTATRVANRSAAHRPVHNRSGATEELGQRPTTWDN